MKPLRVLVVEDSATTRLLLEEIITADPRLALLDSCASAEEAIVALERVRPDVVSMDILLPGMSGLDAIREILPRHPVPIVVISSTTSSAEAETAIAALHAGALAVLPKPEGPDAPQFTRQSRRITDTLVAMAQVKVIRRTRAARSGPAPLPAPVSPPARISTGAPPFGIGIAASTGGPVALVDLLAPLPRSFGLPILLVQHIAPGFTDSFADWLDKTIALSVSVARHDAPLEPGRVYVAPEGTHLTVRGRRTALLDAPPEGVHRPSASVLFRSMAEQWGAAALGVILSGMGRDGADGLLALRRAGAWTAGQEASSCAVFGMPQAAAEIGATSALLSLEEIVQHFLARAVPPGVSVP